MTGNQRYHRSAYEGDVCLYTLQPPEASCETQRLR